MGWHRILLAPRFSTASGSTESPGAVIKTPCGYEDGGESMKLLDHIRRMGPAVWLFLLYQNNAELSGDPVWAPVVQEKAVMDAEVASVLKISASTAVRWRRRLERIE